MAPEITVHNHWPLRLARRLRPDLPETLDAQHISAVGDVLTLLYTVPAALLGLAWLVNVTDLQVLRSQWLLLAGFLGMMFLFGWLRFFFIAEISKAYASTDGSLEGAFAWAAIFLMGPTALWLSILQTLVQAVYSWVQFPSANSRWNNLRSFVTNTAVNTLAYLVALKVYEALGGSYPMAELSLLSIGQGLVTIVLTFALTLLVWSGYTLYTTWGVRTIMQAPTVWPILRFFLLAMGLPALAFPFGILIAGLYVKAGIWVDIFFVFGLLLVALLARQLSWAGERTRQQSRQLEQLEHLGREIITAPLDGSTLPALLEEHVPTMFSAGRVAVWIAPDRFLLRNPPDWDLPIGQSWPWLQNQSDGRVFLRRDPLPWKADGLRERSVIIAPILDTKKNQVIGGIQVEVSSQIIQWNPRDLQNLLPPIQSLAAQIASALHQAKVYAETLAYQRTLEELALARRIQSSFLPENLPKIPGWQLAATLEPAREIAGDYYDFIELPNGKWGLLIADVADKGVGPALYMALSRTLIRTFAAQYPDEPETVLAGANRRILSDARANLFVTVFYGVLDPATGMLTYCNAGHPPACLFDSRTGSLQLLGNTGMPIGIDEDARLRRATAQMMPGDVLLIYTDGVTDAQNERGEFIDRRPILETSPAPRGTSAQAILTSIVADVHTFVAGAPQFDDITLVILSRN